MADVDDQWHKVVAGKKVRTARYGSGKRWRARWRDETGQQRQQSFDRKLDADRHVATVEADMLRKTYIDPTAGRETFRDFAERWRIGQIHEDTTLSQVETHLRRHVYPVFGQRQLASIKPSEAQAWVRGMEAGRDGRAPLMPATVQVVVRYVVAIGHAAVADKVIAANPFVKLARTRPVKKRVVPMTGDQVAGLRGEFAELWRAMVDLGAGTGVRQGEAFGVEVDCIDWLRRKLHVRQQVVQMPGVAPYLRLPKGKKTRTVPMADAVARALSEHIRRFPPVEVLIHDRTNLAKPCWRKAHLLFTRVDGEALQRARFQTGIWHPARKAAGLPVEITFHDLRHFFASALIRYGESVKTVQDALGHATAKETMDTYGHLWPDSEDRTRAAIDAAFTNDVGQMWAEPDGQAI